MNAPPFPPFPPFPANPTLGQRFGSWVWNGAQWVPAGASGIIVNFQTFTTAGQTLTYIPSPGILSAIVECVGAGGGGGGVFATTGWNGSGGGGGSGGYSRSVLAAALVLGGVNVVIGAGGSGAAITGGTTPHETPAQAGGTTSFGSLCVAYGGAPGLTLQPSTMGQPGAGASVGVGNLVIAGNAGSYFLTTGGVTGSVAAVMSGRGGVAPVLGGGLPVPNVTIRGQTEVVDGVGVVVGPGGGGQPGTAADATYADNSNGGAGGAGLCVVTEYCSGDAGVPPPGCGAPVAWNCGPGWGQPC